MRQASTETVEEYFRRFEAAIDLVHLSHDTQVFDNNRLHHFELTNDPHDAPLLAKDCFDDSWYLVEDFLLTTY